MFPIPGYVKIDIWADINCHSLLAQQTSRGFANFLLDWYGWCFIMVIPHPYITVKASMYVEGAILVVHNCMMNNACNSRSWLGWCLFSMIHSMGRMQICVQEYSLTFAVAMLLHFVPFALFEGHEVTFGWWDTPSDPRATPERPPKTHVSRSRLLQSAEAICDLKMSSHETKYCWEALGFMMFPLQRQLSLGYSPALGPNLLVCYHIDQDQLV